MQSTIDEEFIFYSDDEDEKVFYTNIAKKSPITYKSSPPPLKVHLSTSNHLNSASLIHNTTPAASRFDWSATSYSSLLNYTNSFDNPPVDTNYVAPKPNFSAITNSNKHNTYQTDPIHKELSSLIYNTKSTHNFNSIEKSSSYGHAYQSLIMDQRRTRSLDLTPSMNYSSDSFSSLSSSHAEAPNLVTSLPYNPLKYMDPSQPKYMDPSQPKYMDPSQPKYMDPSQPKSNNPQLSNSPQINSKDPWPVKVLATSPRAIQQLTRTTSWSQIASKPATPLPTPPAPRTASPKLTPSPPPSDQTPLGPPEYHRGPKVDPRWPIEQQLFLGPIPVIVTWDEIRAAFYNKINRQHVVHTYVQSKAVNEVVYGMIVFDKAATAKKILKDGHISVKGYLIRVSPMCQRLQARKK